MGIEFVQNDTGSRLLDTAIDNATELPINLTGGTVRARYKIGGGALQTKQMTITDAANGKAEYLFLAGELAPGSLEGEIEIIDAGGKVITSLETFKFGIRTKLV
jgi:hypothetical protein